MEDYFAGEKAGGITLIAMGAAGLGSGGVLLSRDSELADGLSYPLLGIGLAHAAAGVFVYVASDRRIDELGVQIARDDKAFANEEYDRMKGVQTQFFVLKIVEGVLIAGGVGLAIYADRDDRPTLSGVGAGIAIEAAATVVFDFIAARRAAGYVDKLEPLRVMATPDMVGAAYTVRF